MTLTAEAHACGKRLMEHYHRPSMSNVVEFLIREAAKSIGRNGDV